MRDSRARASLGGGGGRGRLTAEWATEAIDEGGSPNGLVAGVRLLAFSWALKNGLLAALLREALEVSMNGS